MKYITVDIGSTFIKAGLFDMATESQVAMVKYPTPPKRDGGSGIYEISAGAFVDVVKGIIRLFCKSHPDTDGILFSTQQHGCVICHPELAEDTYISWQDTRSLRPRKGSSVSYMDELKGIFSREDMEANGVYIKPALALCNLYALFEEGTLSRSKETRIHTLGSYLIEKLTGSKVCHITNAAPMGFADIQKVQWRWDMLERIGLDFIQLPEITSEIEVCGVCQEGGVPIKVFPDVGDVQTSVYGTSAGTGDLVVNIATSGQLIYLTDRFVPGNYEIRPYFDGKYCNVISCMPGGRNFDVQIDYVRDIGEKIFHTSLNRGEVWERIHQLGRSEDVRGLEVDCGFYELPDRLADGNIRHIHHDNLTLQNVIRATAVDFGKTYRRYADYLWRQEEAPGRVYFAGGAVQKNQELQAAIREEMGCETVCGPSDEVFKGMERLLKGYEASLRNNA